MKRATAVLFLLACLGAAPACGPPVAALASAETAAAPLVDARILAHFDVSTGQYAENLALEPDGDADVVLSAAGQIGRVGPRGHLRILGTIPLQAGQFLGGIARAADGALYVSAVTHDPATHGIWRLRRGGAPERFAPLPAAGWGNGVTVSARGDGLLVADSLLGTIWAVPFDGSGARPWLVAPALAPQFFIGANGIKARRDAVYVTNSDSGDLLRIAVTRTGAPGAVRTVARLAGLADDFAFVPRSDDLLVALNQANQVVRVRPDGAAAVVLTAADGLSNPSSVAIRGRRVYVTSLAFFTGTDPNLLVARLPDDCDDDDDER